MKDSATPKIESGDMYHKNSTSMKSRRNEADEEGKTKGEKTKMKR